MRRVGGVRIAISDLLLCLKFIIAARRIDRSGNVTSLDAPRHRYKSLWQAGRGFENSIFADGPAQCGGESRAVCKPNLSSGYRQRVKRAPRRLGAVTTDYFRQGEFSDILAVEFSRDLRPPDAPNPGAEQETESQACQHSINPCSGFVCCLAEANSDQPVNGLPAF